MTLSLTNKGFDYVAYYNGAYENADSLDALAQTSANSIEASVEYGIDPQTSTVYADANYTDSLAALGATIRQAAGLGLSVMVRPLVDFVNPADLTGTPYSVDDWRTYFNPGAAGSATANAFFASYKTMILQEAQVAAANGATSLCIGTELDQIAGPSYKSYWDSIITALRADDPTLKLTYAADWDDDVSPWQWGGTGLAAGTGNLATQVSFAGELDSIGLDVYAPISDAANPDLAQLVAGWTGKPTDETSLAVTGGQSLIAYFESVAAAVGKPLVFTELGYENATDAASQPAGSSTNVVDSTLQAQLYQAFFEAWQKAGNSALTGVYFWNWDPNAAEVGPGQGANFSPQGLPAQSVATDWFGPGPAISFNAPVYGGDGKVTLTGSATDNVGTQSVELFDGTTDLGAAAVNTATGAWTYSGTFAPGAHQFGVVATDQDGNESSALAPFVVNLETPQALAISGARAAQTTTSEASVAPFASVTIADPNPGATESLTITLTGAGGVLSGPGLGGGANGVYALSGAPTLVTEELDALTFTPAAGAPNTTSTTTFALDDTSSAGVSASDDSTSVIDDDPGVNPVAAFNTGVAFAGRTKATLTGTVADPYGVTSLEVFSDGEDLGAATLRKNGVWTFAATLPRATYSAISVVATDRIGDVSSTEAPFQIQTGIRNQPYTTLESDFNALGQDVADTYTEANGVVFLQDYVAYKSSGASTVQWTSGAYFNAFDYFYETIDLSPANATLQQSFYNDDGTHTIVGSANGQHLAALGDDVMTGGGVRETFVFDAHPGAETITDFKAGGPGHDFISLPHGEFADAAQILHGYVRQDGDNAVITLGPHSAITLENVAADTLTRSDFILRG